MLQFVSFLLFSFVLYFIISFLQHVPFPPRVVFCKRSISSDRSRNCCRAKYIPLILSWATTINKFQGFQAGPSNHNLVRYIVADVSSREDELNRPGLLYVATSRAETLGNKDLPFECSSLFLRHQT